MSMCVVNPYAVGSTGAGGFVLPSVSANILCWIEARLETAYADGGAMATLTDRSGHGNNWSQATSGNRGVWKSNIVNGNAVYRFTAASAHFYSLASDIMSGKTSGEVFLVFKLNAQPGAAGKDGLWNMDGDNGNAFNVVYQADSKIYDGWGSTARKSTGVVPSPSFANWTIYNIKSAAGEWTIWQNGTQIYTTATNTFSSFSDGRGGLLGKSDGGSGATYLDADVAALAICDAGLDSTDRATIKNALATTYGITVA